MQNKILIIVHQEQSTPGRVGMLLEERDYELDIRRPRFGDPLPETMDEHKAAIIFGGPMSANDPDDFIKKEIDWCSVPLKERAPFFGICLGAQMLAKNLGGGVHAHPEGKAEIGFYPVIDERPENHNQVMPTAPSHFFQWHVEGFDLPRGAQQLMSGDMFKNQAFQLDDAIFGAQFHTEVTLAMHYRWLIGGAERMKMPGSMPREQHLEGRLLYDRPVKLWLNQFLDNWLAADPR